MTSEFSIAVHALTYLNHKQCTISSERLAENICTNPARVRKVMAKLKRAALVTTREGAEGGYLLVQPAAQIDLARVGDAVGACYVGVAWHSGDVDMDCLIASGIANLMDEVYARLNRICSEKLRKITIADIDRCIFSGARLPDQWEDKVNGIDD